VGLALPGVGPVRCPVIIGNNLVYLDYNHLGFEYSLALEPVIGALVDRALAGS
jgi:hypothetical protein